MFEVPRGRAGKEFIEELTRLFNLFIYKTKWRPVALKLVHVFLPIMLQRPAPKSKPQHNSKYLRERLKLWADGDLDTILKQCCQIQKQLKVRHKEQSVNYTKAFCRLMLQGRVRKALKYVNNDEQLAGGVHQLSEEVITELKKKHPEPGTENPLAFLDIKSEPTDPVIFENLDATMIQKAAKDLDGAGGPTRVNAQIWKLMICSKLHH